MLKYRFCILCVALLSTFFVERTVAACVGGVTVFPYQESFESGPGNWTTGGIASDWQLGIPSKAIINSAGDGLQCWMTGGLTGSLYNPGQRSWLQSPCFDFSTLQRPEIRFLIYWETEYQFDGGNLQYSLDGISWTTIGSASVSNCLADNWYTINSITNLSGLASPSSGWSGTSLPTSGSCRGGNGSNGWVTARYCLSDLAGQPSVYFRFTFGSGTTCNGYDGLAIDKFEVYELPSSPTTISYSCISSRTILFTDDQPACRTNRVWDFGDGTTETNSAATISHTYSTEGSYAVSLSADHACRGLEVATTNVTLLGFSAEITPVSCLDGEDGTIVIQPLPSGAPGFQIVWDNPTLSGFTLGSLSSGNYSFTLTATAACSISDTVFIPIAATASVVPDLGTDRTFCPIDSELIGAGFSFSSYQWQNGDTLPFLRPEEQGWYWLRVTNEAGCEGTDSLYLELNCLDEPIFPAAFTPNNDGINDIFIVYSGATTILKWYIFDRWGQQFFTTDTANDYWDGKQVPEGVYTCMVTYTLVSGEERYKFGKVTLIR